MTTLDKVVRTCSSTLAALLVGAGVAHGQPASQPPGGAPALLSAQAHVSYTWPSRVWLALDATSFAGGDTRVDGVANPDHQENSRLGVTLSIPFGPRHSMKLTYSEGATTRRGNDFESFMLTWQHVKF